MQFIPAYFPPISYTAKLLNGNIIFTVGGNYQKQTYRNRCSIHGANGKLNLTVPIDHDGERKDQKIKLNTSFNWKDQHWKSFSAAYRSSPFFEFYEDELNACFFQEQKYLANFNLQLIELIMQWLDVPFTYSLQKEYKPLTPEESSYINAKINPEILMPQYNQVFETKNGFLPHLSILDLIFNLGPESRDYLTQYAALLPSQT